MSYNSILAVISESAEADQVIAVAARLADQFDAHVVGVQAELGHELAPVAALAAPYPLGLEAPAFGHERTIKDAFMARSRSEGFVLDWHQVDAEPARALAALDRLSRSCDLILLRQPEPEASDPKLKRCEHLLFQSGRPVLFVPYVLRQAFSIRRVLIAWNGSREAARAVSDARPFLLGAEKVEVLVVENTNEAEPDRLSGATYLAASLARQGVKATVSRDIAAGQPVGSIIENRLANFGADLLVMGAFSRSRLYERIFGGVTRELLASMPSLTLMAH